ncbi:MAG: NUDIX hydrolase [Anaerolineales bacterium]|jgi:8-oxo-dGTP diphosphatase
MKLATLCYVRHQGKTLMIHRIKKEYDIHKGKWNGLGGKFETGETPEECARREILEESGLTATNLSLKGLLTFPAFANDEDWYAFVFVVDQFEGEIISSPEGEIKWIEDEKLTELELWEGDRYFLPWLNQSGFFSGKFIYKDGNFIGHQVEFYD